MSADPIKQKEYLLFRGLTSVNAYFVLRLAVGLLLLFAATMKARQLSTVPTLKEGLLNAYGVNFLAVEWEIFLGFWLILGPYPSQTRKFTAFFFVLLFTISVYKYVRGETFCGCLGSVPVRAWQMALLDAFIVAMFIGVRTAETVIRPIPVKCIALVFILWGIVTLLSLVGPFDPVDRSAPWSVYVGDDGQMNFVLIPRNWIGQKFPLPALLEETDLPLESYEKLKVENGTVILFHFDCAKCKDAVEKMPSVEDVIFIEIPSEENNERLFSLDKYITLPPDRHWWCETPVIIEIQNGIVQAVREGGDL